MLAEIGDARGRFPTDDALAAAAGVSPSTRASVLNHAVQRQFAPRMAPHGAAAAGRFDARPRLA
nr:transposase [Pseudonocardia acidicola]